MSEPKQNCLSYKHYDECEKFADGRCLLKMQKQKCRYCGREFFTARKGRMYCSKACAEAACALNQAKRKMKKRKK